MLHLIPYAMAAYGGYKGYKGAKDSGASGIGSIMGGLTGAYTGYSLGTAGMNMFPGSAAAQKFAAMPLTQSLGGIPGVPQARATVNPAQFPGVNKTGEATFASDMIRDQKNAGVTQDGGGSLLDILRNKDAKGNIIEGYDPMKVGLLAGGVPLALGAFDQGPTDVYMPGYNMGYLDLKRERPKYTYIDPETGQEKEYEQMYSPEEAGLGDRRAGPYSVSKETFNTGGLAEIKKFNEGGVNYLPSKTSHDENDSNNYVRATGYVEDGAGVGDKDEDTMLAQLADGEFVTRADGVLGAGIIAGANPNSIKDMREKGAKYFYEQQSRYKRVFDLLKEANGNSKQKTN